MSEWFKDWFESSDYLDVYSHRDETDAKNLLSMIQKNFNFNKNAKLLDAACGNGRFSNLFSEAGFDVTSFDLSLPLLKIAKSKSIGKHLTVKYFKSDVRHVPLQFKGFFDLILNMFTSFGYFMTDNENFSFIRKSYDLLNNNGYFVFDYLNKEFVIHNFSPKSQKIINDKIITEERIINNNRVEKKIIIQSKNEKKTFHESVYLYSKDEIINGFNSCGFKVNDIYGDYFGNRFEDLASERLLIIFNKI